MRSLVFATPLHVLQFAMGVVLFAVMLLTGVDVIGRYLFNRPVLGADEYIAYGMAIIIFGGLPLTSLRNEQITADFASGVLRGTARQIARRFAQLFAAVVLGYLATRLYVLAGKQVTNLDGSTMLRLPYAPLGYFMTVMAAVSAIICASATVARETLPEPGGDLVGEIEPPR